MAQEEKQASKRRKTLERELEWINMAPKARQAKGKARLNSYEALLNEDRKNAKPNWKSLSRTVRAWEQGDRGPACSKSIW